MKPFILLASLPLVTACRLVVDVDDDDRPDASEACGLAQDYEVCPECYSGEVECIYGDHSAVAASCGDCQARGALYADLCDAGVIDDREEIERDTTCEVIDGIDTGTE